jgi:hypothetical protein
MNKHYQKRYDKFIDSLREQEISGYTERHHILPKSLGGANAKTNIIKLTPRQHYIAHWMLWKIHGGAMTRAFFLMSHEDRNHRINSKTYSLAREKYSEEVKEQLAKKPNVPIFTPEHREKLRQAKLGTKLSAETRKKVGDAQRGRKLSDETKRKISATKKQQAYLAWLTAGNTPLPAEEPTQE